MRLLLPSFLGVMATPGAPFRHAGHALCVSHVGNSTHTSHSSLSWQIFHCLKCGLKYGRASTEHVDAEKMRVCIAALWCGGRTTSLESCYQGAAISEAYSASVACCSQQPCYCLISAARLQPGTLMVPHTSPTIRLSRLPLLTLLFHCLSQLVQEEQI